MSSIESLESYVNNIVGIVSVMATDGKPMATEVRPVATDGKSIAIDGKSVEDCVDGCEQKKPMSPAVDLTDKVLVEEVLAANAVLDEKVNHLQELAVSLREENSSVARKVDELQSKCLESERLVQELADIKNMIGECRKGFVEEVATRLQEVEHKFQTECQRLGAEHQSKVDVLENTLKASLESNQSLETKFNELICKLAELEAVREDNDKLINELIAYKQELSICRTQQEESVREMNTPQEETDHKPVDEPQEPIQTLPKNVMDMETDEQISHLVDLYREFAKTPIPLSGQLLNGDNERQKSLQVVWKVRDLDRMEATKFGTNYSIKVTKEGNGIKHISAVGRPVDVTNDLANSLPTNESPYRAVVRKSGSDSTKFKQWLEIWDKTTKIKSIDIDSVEEHSSLVIDPQFGNFLWSPNGKQLLYVCEYKSPKVSNYFKKQSKKYENSESETRGHEFVYRDDWSECFDGLVHTVIAILDIENDFKIRTIEMSDYSLGQPIWLTDTSLAFVGWKESPRRLGIVFCTNRLSSVFICDLKSEDLQPIRISSDDNTAVSDPRLTPDGKVLVYLENPSGGAHQQPNRLMKYDLESNSSKVLVDSNEVRELIPNGNGHKYGKICTLFVDGLTANCFTSDGQYLILTSYTELQSVLCAVDLTSGQLKAIPFPTESVRLLDIKDDLIVAVGSATTSMPNVFVGKLTDNLEAIDWKEIKHNSSDCLEDITSQQFYIPSEDPKKLITALLISPKAVEANPAPTIILPHGGSYAVYTESYGFYRVLFAKLGLKLLLVNYRGSLGVDNEYVNTLTENSKNVIDVIDCIRHMTDQNLVDSTKLMLFNPTYNSFFVTELSLDDPDIQFKACVVREPAIGLLSEGLPLAVTEPMSSLRDSESLKEMFNGVHTVPTLFLLDGDDRSLTTSQALKYYRLLKDRGVETKTRFYTNNDSADRVNIESDVFISASLWMLSHLK